MRRGIVRVSVPFLAQALDAAMRTSLCSFLESCGVAMWALGAGKPPAPPADDDGCAICYGALEPSPQSFALRCGHWFCGSCWRGLVASKVRGTRGGCWAFVSLLLLFVLPPLPRSPPLPCSPLPPSPFSLCHYPPLLLPIRVSSFSTPLRYNPHTLLSSPLVLYSYLAPCM